MFKKLLSLYLWALKNEEIFNGNFSSMCIDVCIDNVFKTKN